MFLYKVSIFLPQFREYISYFRQTILKRLFSLKPEGGGGCHKVYHHISICSALILIKVKAFLRLGVTISNNLGLASNIHFQKSNEALIWSRIGGIGHIFYRGLRISHFGTGSDLNFFLLDVSHYHNYHRVSIKFLFPKYDQKSYLDFRNWKWHECL